MERLSTSLAPAIADVALDVGRFEHSVLLFGIAAPFRLALSSPTAQRIAFGEDLMHVASDLEIIANASLQAIAMPALIEAAPELIIDANPQLRHVAFDALARAELVFVRGNPRLPTCEVLAAFSQVTGAFLVQHGNDATASCTP